MTNDVCVLFIEEPFDEIRSCVVYKSFTGRFDQSIEHRAKLMFHEIGDIFSVVGDIVFHDS